MSGRSFIVLAIAVSTVVRLSTASAELRTVDSIATIGGNLITVCVEKSLACLAKGRSLLILDLSISNHPKRIGQLDFPGVIDEMAWAGEDSVLVVGESIGLVQVDLSDPVQPHIAGCTSVKSKPNRLKVKDGTAFVLEVMGVLERFDIRSSSGPVFSASYSLEGPPRDFDFEGEIGCGISTINPDYPNGRPIPQPPASTGSRPAISKGYCVLIYRMEGGEKPVRSSVIEVSDYPSQIVLSGGIGAVSVREGVELIDIRDPSKPVVLSFLNEKTVSGRCAISGPLLFVPGSPPTALTIYDIANPHEPKKVGTYESEGATGVVVNGKTACLLSSSLEVLDVADPAKPVLAGKVEEAFAPECIVVRDRRIYASDRSSRLVILDAATPSNPLQLGHERLAAKAQTLTVSGTFVYAGCGGYGLNVLDASNPATVRRINVTPKLTNPNRILLQGPYAYVAAKAGMYVLDIRRPSEPKIISLYSAEQTVLDIQMRGSLVYAAGCFTGLHIIGVDYPSSPIFLNLKQTPSCANRITLSDRMAYVCHQSDEILCFDLMDPMNPSIAGRIKWRGGRIKVRGSLLYVLSYNSITAMSLADATCPTPIVAYPCSGAMDFDLDDDFLYVADTSAGLRVFSLVKN